MIRRLQRRYVTWIVGVVVAGGALYVAFSSAGGFSDAYESLRQSSPRWLALAALTEAASYVFVGLLLRRLVGGVHVSRATAIQLGLVLCGLGPMLPAAPAEGIALTTTELERRGTSAGHAVMAIGLAQWYMTRTLLGLVALGTLGVAVGVQVRLPRNTPWFVSSGVLIIAASAILALLVLTGWLARRRATAEFFSIVASRIRFWRPREPIDALRERGSAWHNHAREILGTTRSQLILGVTTLSACLLDLACFRLALQAAHVNPRRGMSVIAYALTVVASSVPFIPAGIGLVESVVPAILRRRRTPLQVALAGLLVYRALATVVPAIVGAVAAARLRFRPVD